MLVRKFDATPEEVAEAKEIMSYAARTVKPVVQLNVIKEDPDDDRILECGVSGGSDYIVTGDNHLLKLGVYNGMRILNVSDFLALAQGQARSL